MPIALLLLRMIRALTHDLSCSQGGRILAPWEPVEALNGGTIIVNSPVVFTGVASTHHYYVTNGDTIQIDHDIVFTGSKEPDKW